MSELTKSQLSLQRGDVVLIMTDDGDELEDVVRHSPSMISVHTWIVWLRLHGGFLLTRVHRKVLAVYRFDDTEVRSHVVAYSQRRAVRIFERTMDLGTNVDVYELEGHVALKIDDDERTVDEWITSDPKERFL